MKKIKEENEYGGIDEDLSLKSILIASFVSFALIAGLFSLLLL